MPSTGVALAIRFDHSARRRILDRDLVTGGRLPAAADEEPVGDAIE